MDNAYAKTSIRPGATDLHNQIQPVYLPREDIDALGVKYRRIPIMSIGRDIYCDTRLILQKLEEKFPSGALGTSQPDQKAVEKLLESWTSESSFPNKCLPFHHVSGAGGLFRLLRHAFCL